MSHIYTSRTLNDLLQQSLTKLCEEQAHTTKLKNLLTVFLGDDPFVNLEKMQWPDEDFAAIARERSDYLLRELGGPLLSARGSISNPTTTAPPPPPPPAPAAVPSVPAPASSTTTLISPSKPTTNGDHPAPPPKDPIPPTTTTSTTTITTTTTTITTTTTDTPPPLSSSASENPAPPLQQPPLTSSTTTATIAEEMDLDPPPSSAPPLKTEPTTPPTPPPPAPTRRMTTRSAQNPHHPTSPPTHSSTSPHSEIDPWFFPPSFRVDPDYGLPAPEAAETRRLLSSAVQHQDEFLRGLNKVREGLLRAERFRKYVWGWCRAMEGTREYIAAGGGGGGGGAGGGEEGGIGGVDAEVEAGATLSDGEDYYDPVEWGLDEPLEKGKEEEEENGGEVVNTGKKTRGRRTVGN
ncbi:hypothetical protein L873DRAFT_1810455 [Choiromyces venosus 120613-1]|uniref:Transcriptional regulatory protein RXT2 N-terminal domain-containing protein n=1 Tax=Choiromyces venosus 120613-1 TaxID=1336337 RepID=A0A3N4JFE4_9PEZI|nr:hypothetical protein L873DRAFT_1810455 [Choiromyces venosus 120613-1]